MTNPRGCFPLVLVLVALEGHLSSVLALLLPESWIEALRVRDGNVLKKIKKIKINGNQRKKVNRFEAMVWQGVVFPFIY